MQPVRVGIIGTGFGITTHLPAFRALPGVEVTAIMSAKLPRAEAVAREHGIPAAYDDVRRLVEAPDIDLVSIASTPDVHLEQVLTCLDAGKPLLCEKPVSNDLDEVRKMAEAARGAGVVNAVNHEFRYMPMNRRVRELLHSGELGRPLHVSMRMNDDLATYRRFPEWYWQREKGGGALMLLYSHYIDLAFSWFGDLTGVAGTTSRYYPTREVRSSDRAESDDDGSKQMAVDVEDAVAFAARLPDGGLLSFDGSWSVHHPGGVRVEVFGESGTMRMHGPGMGQDKTPAEIRVAAADGDEFQVLPLARAETPGVEELVGAMAAQLADVVSAVRGETASADGTTEFATLEDALRVQEVMDGLMSR